MAETKTAVQESIVTFGALFLLAVAGRVLFGNLTNITGIEPVIPLAVLAGLFYGGRYGFAVGAGGYALGNIFLGQFGGIGFAMVYSALAGGIAGYLGRYANREKYLGTVIVATIVYEIIYRLWNADFVYPSAAITESFPMILTHIAGNLVFTFGLGIWFFREPGQKK
ncbi:MAG: hypothetical protein V1777_04880 [Candidatus Micrarchaeota archaeon]